MRKLASILIRDGWTCVRGAGATFPLWKPSTHLEYMLNGSFTDVIVASDDPRQLFALDTQCHLNLVAALGWSGVTEIRELFEAGYSKIFFGGVQRQFPDQKEADIFAEMVQIYGSSSFGYSFHFGSIIPDLMSSFLAQFNEILFVHDSFQIQVDPEKAKTLARFTDSLVSHETHELNLCTPSVNYQVWLQSANQPINHVNYCEHGIARLR